MQFLFLCVGLLMEKKRKASVSSFGINQVTRRSAWTKNVEWRARACPHLAPPS